MWLVHIKYLFFKFTHVGGFFYTHLYFLLLYQGNKLRHTTISGSSNVAKYNTYVQRSDSNYITYNQRSVQCPRKCILSYFERICPQGALCLEDTIFQRVCPKTFVRTIVVRASCFLYAMFETDVHIQLYLFITIWVRHIFTYYYIL